MCIRDRYGNEVVDWVPGIDGVIASAVLKPAADMVKLGRVPSGASMTVEPAGDGQVRLRL